MGLAELPGPVGSRAQRRAGRGSDRAGLGNGSGLLIALRLGLRHGLRFGQQQLFHPAAESTPQPSTAQMTSNSSSLTVFGWPDHRPDIFPALLTMPRAASRRRSSLAFQMPRLATA
ncbi:MAG: hypothetical protein ACRDOH_16310 [Streptosporangiaceae bacterium]